MVIGKDQKSTNSSLQKSANPAAATIPKTSANKKLIPWIVGIAIVTVVGVGTTYGVYQMRQQNATSVPPVSVAPASKVTALGRLEPQGEVIKLSVANAQDSRVNQLLVEEGDRVRAGQLIATLQGLDKKQAELVEANKNADIYRAKLAKIQAGEAKEAEIMAQQANIARLEAQLSTETIQREAAIANVEAELANAQINYQRYQTLYLQGAVSQADFDNTKETYQRAQARLQETQAQLANTVSTLKEQIASEKAMLDELKEVRPVDVREAQAELERAIAQVKRIESELEDYYVRVPIDGQILKINTLVGEQVDISEGIVELGRTKQMYAIAEVYETDVGKVEVGQRATVISEHGGFEGELEGTVDHIGLQIKKQDILESDPAADKDARIVEVKVRLDREDSDRVAGLTNLQVRVRINLNK